MRRAISVELLVFASYLHFEPVFANNKAYKRNTDN